MTLTKGSMLLRKRAEEILKLVENRNRTDAIKRNCERRYGERGGIWQIAKTAQQYQKIILTSAFIL